MINFLNQYSNLILATLTGLYVLFTYKILKTNKDLINMMIIQNEEQKRPYIQIRAYDRSKVITCLLIKNTGKSPAYDVKFELDKDFFRYGKDENIKDFPLFKDGVMFFPPETEYHYDLGQYWLFFSEGKKETEIKTPPIFKVKCTYRSTNKTYIEESIIDIKSTLKSQLIIDEKVEKLEEIGKQLKEIAKDINKISSKSK